MYPMNKAFIVKLGWGLLMTAATFVLESCVESILEQKIIFPRFKLEGRILLYGKLFARFGPR
jgi:hypothetical protein